MSTLVPFLLRSMPLMAAGCLMLAGCDRDPPADPAPPAAAVPETAPAPTPALVPALDRAGFLEIAARAAADYAAGRQAQGADPLVGRRFAIRSAFGCGDPDARAADAPGDGLARWRRDESGETIRLTLAPEDWSGSALLSEAVDGHWEAIEGFWVPRPWMAAEECSAVRPDPLAGPSVASPQTVGLAAVFESGGSRLGRRNGRAYAFTVRGAGEARAVRPAEGWMVAMEGRFAAFPEGRAVRCRASGPDQRPVCVAAVQMDRVAFLAADDAVLGEWRAG